MDEEYLKSITIRRVYEEDLQEDSQLATGVPGVSSNVDAQGHVVLTIRGETPDDTAHFTLLEQARSPAPIPREILSDLVSLQCALISGTRDKDKPFCYHEQDEASVEKQFKTLLEKYGVKVEGSEALAKREQAEWEALIDQATKPQYLDVPKRIQMSPTTWGVEETSLTLMREGDKEAAGLVAIEAAKRNNLTLWLEAKAWRSGARSGHYSGMLDRVLIAFNQDSVVRHQMPFMDTPEKKVKNPFLWRSNARIAAAVGVLYWFLYVAFRIFK